MKTIWMGYEPVHLVVFPHPNTQLQDTYVDLENMHISEITFKKLKRHEDVLT
jgi:hypothetical protein